MQRIVTKAEEKGAQMTEADLLDAVRDNNQIGRFFDSLCCCFCNSSYELGDTEKLALATQFLKGFNALKSDTKFIKLAGCNRTGTSTNMTLSNESEGVFLKIGTENPVKIKDGTLQSLKGMTYVPTTDSVDPSVSNTSGSDSGDEPNWPKQTFDWYYGEGAYNETYAEQFKSSGVSSTTNTTTTTTTAKKQSTLAPVQSVNQNSTTPKPGVDVSKGGSKTGSNSSAAPNKSKTLQRTNAKQHNSQSPTSNNVSSPNQGNPKIGSTTGSRNGCTLSPKKIQEMEAAREHAINQAKTQMSNVDLLVVLKEYDKQVYEKTGYRRPTQHEEGSYQQILGDFDNLRTANFMDNLNVLSQYNSAMEQKGFGSRAGANPTGLGTLSKKSETTGLLAGQNRDSVEKKTVDVQPKQKKGWKK